MSISEYAKIGKEEIKLDPTKSSLTCGGEPSSALLLNDLMYQQSDGSYITAEEAVLRDPIPITELSITVGPSDATVTWEGVQKVTYFLDGTANGVVYNDPARTIHLTGLLTGQHYIVLNAEGSNRVLKAVFTIGFEAVEDIQVTYGGGMLDISMLQSVDVQVTYGGGVLNTVIPQSVDIQISYN